MRATAIQDLLTGRLDRVTLTAVTFEQQRLLAALWQWAEHGGRIAIVANGQPVYDVTMEVTEPASEPDAE